MIFFKSPMQNKMTNVHDIRKLTIDLSAPNVIWSIIIIIIINTESGSHCWVSYMHPGPVDEIYGCPILKWIAVSWHQDSASG